MRPEDVPILAAGHRMSRVLATAVDLDLPARLAAGPATPTELASQTGCDARSLARFLRVLASEGVIGFDGTRYSTNAVTEALGRDAVVIRGWAGLDEAYAAFGGLTEGIRTGGSPFAAHFGQTFYAYHASHPDRAAPYVAAVEAMGGDEPELLAMLRVDRFDRFVDVGGEHGSLLWAVLRARPEAAGVLFDLPATVAGATVPGDLRDRVEVQGGDFFEFVPPGAGAYLLGTVLRTFDDEDAIRMLRRCREAVHEQARLLVIEQVLDEGVPPPPGPMRDLVAFVLYGGRERTRAEFAALFSAAGFRLDSVTAGPGFWSCLEAVPSNS